MSLATPAPLEERRGSPLEVLLAFGKMGFTCFGGPIAHIGYFRDEFVVRRRWLDERAYVDLVALCQFLPGPASSQVGFSIGLMRAGYLGGLAAWLGFTLPSAVALVLFAFGAGACTMVSFARKKPDPEKFLAVPLSEISADDLQKLMFKKIDKLREEIVSAEKEETSPAISLRENIQREPDRQKLSPWQPIKRPMKI